MKTEYKYDTLGGHIGAKVRLILRKLGVIAFIVSMMPIGAAAQGGGNGNGGGNGSGGGQGPEVTIISQHDVTGGYIIDFVDYVHDFDNCKTYFYYDVHNNNVNPEISHFTFGAESCGATCLDELPGGAYGTWDYQGVNYNLDPSGGTVQLGSDPSTGWCGIKFDDELRSDESMKVFLAVDGIQHPGLVSFVIKAATNAFTAAIPGPASCSAPCDGLNFYKTVSRDTVLAGDTITYRFEIDKIWTAELNTHIWFEDVLEDGLEWIPEPTGLTEGIVLEPFTNGGNPLGSQAKFKILNLPVGVSGFELKAVTPKPYTGGNPYLNQAWISNLPNYMADSKPSDNPATLAEDDPTPLVILNETDCIGTWNKPEIDTEFTVGKDSVDVVSSRPFVNVVLEFHDGEHEMFLDTAGAYSRTFTGTGENEGKCIAGVWVRTACNASGDGPEYGEYIQNPEWNGACEEDPPATQVFFDHGSTVLNNGPWTVTIDLDGNVQIFGPGNGYGHGNGNNGNDQPNLDGPIRGGSHRDHDVTEDRDPEMDNRSFENVPQADLEVYPNPARADQPIYVKGLDQSDWNVHVFSVDGGHIYSGTIQGSDRIEMSGLNLSTGLYFLEFENGLERRSAKVVVH